MNREPAFVENPTFTLPSRLVMRVLVTRPLEDAERTAQALVAKGHVPLVAPLFYIRKLETPFPDTADAVFATSANAIRLADPAMLRSLHAVTLYAVGAATADAARKAGFSTVHAGDGDSRNLAALIRSQMPARSRLLQLAGRPRSDEALLQLKEQYRLATLETYETISANRLPDAIIHALDKDMLDAVLHFSPRATAVFLDHVTECGLAQKATNLIHVCISRAAADIRLVSPRIAAKPTLSAMLIVLARD